MNYAEKLKHPKWQKKRLEILERDGWKCVHCGDDSSTLHVHHIIYSGENPWDADQKWIITLCENCHSTAHHESTCSLTGNIDLIYDWLVACNFSPVLASHTINVSNCVEFSMKDFDEYDTYLVVSMFKRLELYYHIEAKLKSRDSSIYSYWERQVYRYPVFSIFDKFT